MGFTFNYPNYTIVENAYDEIENVCLKYGKTAIVIGGKTAMSKAPGLRSENPDCIEYSSFLHPLIQVHILVRFIFPITKALQTSLFIPQITHASGDRKSSLGVGIELLSELKNAGFEKVTFQVDSAKE